MSNWSFIDHCTNYLNRPRMGDPRAPNLWPSEASAIIEEEGQQKLVGKCRRAVWFRWLSDNISYYKDPEAISAYEPLYKLLKSRTLPPSPYTVWLWRAGDLYEEYLTQLAKEGGVYVASQVSVYIPELQISGKKDLVIIDPETGKLSTIEVKSVYGFGANTVLGTPSARGKGELGVPRESNLMQIALYEWWADAADEQFQAAKLVYGSRDTGRYAEYNVWTEGDSILYSGVAPNITKPITSKITISSILAQYKYVDDSYKNRVVPARDYDLKFSEEKIQELYEAGKLNKTETEKHEKLLAYRKGESKRKIKPVVKGHWQCDLCSFKNICYKSTDEDDPNYGKPEVL
jgi:hypothetical protein